MLAIKMLEMSLSGNPAPTVLRPAGKSVYSSAHLLTGILFIYLNSELFVPSTLENSPSSGRHSSTLTCTLPLLAKGILLHYFSQLLCRGGLTSPPAHFVFLAVCLTVCSQSRLSKPVTSGCRCVWGWIRLCQTCPS
jgi:hypothetical protein